MSDYVQTVDFSSKDLLPSGDPNKLIKGSEFDAEFDAIAMAISSKYDSSDIASQNQAEAESSNTVIMTPLRVGQWADANAGIVGDLQGLSDPNADRLLFWDDSAGAAALLSVSSNLSISGTTLDVGGNVQGAASLYATDANAAGMLADIAALTDPNADRILFWDDSAGSVAGLAAGTGLTISGTTLAIDTSVVPRLNAANTFTTGQQVVGGASSRSNAVRFQRSASGSSAPQLIAIWGEAGGNFIQAESTVEAAKSLIIRATTNDAGDEQTGGSEPSVRILGRANSDLAVFSDVGITLSGSTITLNGVNVTDYARLSQPNVFGTAVASISERMAIGAAGVTRLTLQNTSDSVTTMLLAETSEGVVGTLTEHPLDIRAGNSSAITVDTALKATFKGAVAAPIIATSTSTTLAAGQVHAINGNSTLPNMAAGQWVTVINNSGSSITVTKNGSDTMYWTATGSSVTSVTIPARGRASFVCADGTNVYASGNITGSS